MTHEFISLREFLLLPDFDRPFYVSKYPHTWVAFYDIAKRSFEKYGPEGPPPGSKVIALRDGFSGQAGKELIFQGVFDRDTRFFALRDQFDDNVGLSERRVWFRDFSVSDDLSKDELNIITRWWRL